MKIALFLMSYPPTSETFILNHIALLRDEGHQVELFAQSGPDEAVYSALVSSGKNHRAIERYELDKHVSYFQPLVTSRVRRLATGAAIVARNFLTAPLLILRALNVFRLGKRAASMSVLFSLTPFFEQGTDFDLVHCHFGPTGKIAADLKEAGILRCPVVTTFHGFDINIEPSLSGPDTYADLFRVGDRFTTVSKQTRQRLIALGAPEAKVSALPMSVDVEKFQARTKRSAEPVTTILTVARLHPVKGHKYALHAIKLLSGRHSVRYLLVGVGPLEPELRALVVELELDSIVEFLGHKTHDELPELYARADIFLFPSITDTDGGEEALPVVLMEAQASGLPIVASRTGGVPEVTVDNQSALLVPEKEPQAMADALSTLTEDRELCASMGRQGRVHVTESYDISRFSKRLAEIYDEVLN